MAESLEKERPDKSVSMSKVRSAIEAAMREFESFVKKATIDT
jgi:hypothetical protein